MTDIIAALEPIMLSNTLHYQSDFDYDRELIQTAAGYPEGDIQYFLWMSRPCGTECFLERDVYIRDSYAHHAWIYHAESSGPCIAYAVEVLSLRDGKAMGNLYPLDLRRCAARIAAEAFPARTVSLSFADGFETCCGYEDYRESVYNLAARHGAVTRQVLHPEDERVLDAVLYKTRAERRAK